MIGASKQPRFQPFEVAVDRSEEWVGEIPTVSLDLFVRPEAAHVEQQFHAEATLERKTGARCDVTPAVDDIEGFAALESKRGSPQGLSIEYRGQDRRRLVVGEGVPFDSCLRAELADLAAILIHPRRFLAAEDGDVVAALRQADQIGQDLRSTERVGQPVVGDVKDACTAASLRCLVHSSLPLLSPTW